MKLENPLTFVRSLKGAPASILWAFFFTRRVMTALELQEWTGYQGDALTGALRLLVSLGWLTARSSRGPWCLVDGRQFPLMAGDLLIPDESVLNGFAPSVVVVDESKTNLPTITTITTTRASNPEKTDSGFVEHSSRNLDEHLALVGALNEHKIIGKKRRQLMECEWVTAEYVRGHVTYAQDERIWDQPVGMAITRMLEQVPVPMAEPEATTPKANWWEQRCEDCGEVNCVCPHAEDCECIACKRKFPERFCRATYDAGRGNVSGVFQTCHELAVPGTRYCADHQDPEKRGWFDRDGKESKEREH